MENKDTIYVLECVREKKLAIEREVLEPKKRSIWPKGKKTAHIISLADKYYQISHKK